MNTVAQAKDLLVKYRRHKAVLRPALGRFAWHWLRGSTELPYGPLKLHIEPTSFCNLRCPMCPQSVGANERNGFMTMDLFHKIIDEAKDFVGEANLFFRGESLMHQDIYDMIDVCERAGIAAHINTNATLLRDEKIELLLDAAPSKLTISFDSGEPEQYEVMRKGAAFDRTLERVLRLLEAKKRRGSNGPYVVMQVIQLWDSSFPKGAAPVIPDHFRQRFDGLPVDEWDTFWAHGWAGQLESSDFYSARPHGPNYYPCNWLWKSMAVYWDGTVPSCCADFGEDQIMGNLAEQSLLDIWNSPAYRAIRQAHVSGQLDDYKLCRGCDAVWQDAGSSWQLFTGARTVITGDPLPVLQTRANGANGAAETPPANGTNAANGAPPT